MKKIYQDKAFIFCFVIVSAVCIRGIMYCISNGQSMASSHLEPQFGLKFMQDIAALIFALILLIKRSTRRKWYWYSLPVILVVVGFVYIEIVGQYPCCWGG